MPRLKPIAVSITLLVMIAAALAAGLAALPSNEAGAAGGTLNNSSITGPNLVPTLNITYFNNYNLSVNVDPGGRTINNVSFVIRPQNAGVNNSNWDFLTNGTPNPNPNEAFTRAATNHSGNIWWFGNLRPNNIYPEIAFIRGINSSPSNSRFWGKSYHLMHFTNQFDMGINTSFFIELYATPKTSPPLSVDMQVFLVGNGFNISAFQSGGVFANEAWKNHADVELVGTISQASGFHHTHSANSSHFLIPLSTNSSNNIDIGNKSIDISGDFWLILTTGHQLQNRGWDLKYHAGCNNNGTWYQGSGTNFAPKSGCPDVHVHFARELPAEEYNGMEVYVVVGYTENGSTNNFSSGSQLFYFCELPNLPPNPSAFTAPAPGIYRGNVTISWLPATDPNNDPLTYNVYLINESETAKQIANGITDTFFSLNTSAYPDGFYNISVEACENDTDDLFCTDFDLLSNFDEGFCEFFRIRNGEGGGGIGTTGDPYLICDACDLQNMKLNLSAHYALNNSIDLTGFAWGNWSDGDGFIPVGNDSTPFTGSLNGSGYTITGLFINRSATDYVGLFGYIATGGSASNVSLANINLTGKNCSGGLAGYNSGTISNSSAAGNVSGTGYHAGGLVGNNHAGSITNSSATGNVSLPVACYNAGGLIGLNEQGSTVSGSHSTGTVNGDGTVGGLIGDNVASSVFNCFATGNVSGTGLNVGGLVGWNSGSVNSSYAIGNISGSDWYTGGLVGYNNGGSVNNSYATGNVSGTSNVSGLVGYINMGSVSNSYATGNVSGDNRVGGLAGYNNGSVSSSYAAGGVSGTGNDVGGLAGYNSGNVSDSYAMGNVSGDDYIGGLVGGNYGNVSNSYAMGNVSGNYVSGLVGVNSGNVSNSFYDQTTSGQSDNDGRGVPKTTAQMKTLSTFTGAGWNIEGNSEHNINDGYPYLSWQVPGNSPVWYIYNCSVTLNTSSTAGGDVTTPGEAGPYTYNCSQIVNISATADACYQFVNWTGTGAAAIANTSAASTTINMSANYSVQANFAFEAFAGGNGTSGNPFLIQDLCDLQNMKLNLSAHYALNNSIDLTGFDWGNWSDGDGFIPVGNGNGSFLGAFDGRGYTITGLFVNRSTSDWAGLFGYVNTGGAVSNISLAGVNISGDELVGGLIGLNYGTVSNCSAAGNVNGTVQTGGLVGYNYGTVSNCSAAGNVSTTGSFVGGLVGWNDWSEYSPVIIINSYATSSVSGNDYVGGLAGYNNFSISDSYATGNVSGNNYVGGLLGQNYAGSVNNSYSTGYVSGGGADVGGLVGDNPLGSVNNSFWDMQTSGRATSDGGTGKNTSEMKDFSTFYNAGWDLICESTNGDDDIWGIDYSGAGNDGYPFLWWQGFTHNVSFTLTYSAGINGTFIGTSPQTVGCGGNGTAVEAQPYPCYHFVNWSDSVTDNPRTDLNVFGNINVTANIVANQSTLNTTSTAGGNVTTPGEAGPYTYNCSQIVNISATADACYYFVNWTGTGVDAGKVANTSAASTTITMSNNYSVQANFAIDTFTLNTSSTAGGDVTTPGEAGPYTYNCSQIVNISAAADACYYFVNWTGTGVDAGKVANTSAASTTINMSNNYSVQANFAIYQYNLNYAAGANGSLTGNTSQTVNCGADGAAVEAVPDPCYYFVNWSDAVTDNPRTDTNVTDNISVTANFAIDTFTLNTSSTAGGDVTTPGEAGPYTYNCSQIVNISAAADACYYFVNWTGTGVDAGKVANTSAASTTINMSNNYSVQANFAIYQYNLNYAAGANGSLTGNTSQTVNCGADGAAVEAVPDPCYYFVNWSDAITDNPRTDTNVTNNISVTANFAIDTFMLNTSATAGGSVSVPGEGSFGPYNCSEIVAIAAVNDSCYYFVNWSGTGVDAGMVADPSAASTTINMSHSYAVQANFAIYQYTLNYSAGANGSIAANASQTVNCSSNGLPVTAVPDACYHFVNWSDAVTDNPRTDTNVLGNISATANFAIDKVALTTSSTAGGNVTVPGEPGPFGYDCGDIVTINATPDACYHFVDWTGTGVDAGMVVDPNAASTTINMSANYSVQANFAIDTFTLTYNAGPNGTVTGVTPQTVNCGADGSAVTAVPDACYHFVNWSDAVTDNPRTDTNVLGNITVTANFAIDQFTLTYIAGTGGTINGTSTQTVNCGADGSPVTAMPNTSYIFSQWSDGETNASRTDTNVQGNITVTASFRRPGGGGGYSPPSYLPLNIDIFDHSIMELTDISGQIRGDINAISPDGKVSIHMSAGTTALFGNGSPLTDLNVDPVASPPAPPDGRIVIAAFDFNPDGATFDPAIEITITYDPDDLPEGTDPSHLVIAFYNEATGTWEYLSGTVNPDTNTITFSVTHFTMFAVMVDNESEPVPSETPTPTPTATATVGPTPTATASATPTVAPTATPTATAMPPADDDGSDNREMLVAVIAGCAILGALVAAIAIRMRKK